MQDFNKITKYLFKTDQAKNLKEISKITGYNYTYLSRVKNNPKLVTDEFLLKLKQHFTLPEQVYVNNIIPKKRYLSDEGQKRYKIDSENEIIAFNEPEINIQEKILESGIKSNSAKNLKADLEKEIEYFRTKNNQFRSLNKLTTMLVPLVPMDAHAQYVDEFYNEASDITFEYVTMEVDHFGKGQYMAFKISGDSMDGEYKVNTPNGAVVLAREIGQHLWSGGLYKSKYGHIIITNRNILFKDITHFDKLSGKITLHSRNTSPEYQDFQLRLGECEDETYIRQIFKVLKRNNM